MAHMIDLPGDNTPVYLGANLTLRAPGLKGQARRLDARAPGTRGAEQASPDLDAALGNAGMDEVATIDMAVQPVPPPPAARPVRGADGADAFELTMPDLGPAVGQIVLSVDEAGALHWHFPLDEAQHIQPAALRGHGAVKRFLIPREVAMTPPTVAATAADRSMISLLGRKVLKVLVYPVTDAVFGPAIDKAVAFWESFKRPHRVGRFLPDDRSALSAGDWDRLGQGPALLWVHGTFSTSRAAFGGLPEATLAELATQYGRRVFCFDHPSVSATPMENAQWFFDEMPAHASLEVDIVCHSRGGLLSRLLAQPALAGGDPSRFKVRRIVLVGVPNEGTLLADPDHVVAFLDRCTTALNLTSATPDWTDALEAVLAVVKVIGHAGLHGLDGLAAMCPGHSWLTSLNAAALPGVTLYGIGADFAPANAGLAAAFCTAADSVIDRVFQQAANDLVVPTAGMSSWGGMRQIEPDRHLHFPASRGVLHTSYFTQPETAQALLRWLRATA